MIHVSIRSYIKEKTLNAFEKQISELMKKRKVKMLNNF